MFSLESLHCLSVLANKSGEKLDFTSSYKALICQDLNMVLLSTFWHNDSYILDPVKAKLIFTVPFNNFAHLEFSLHIFERTIKISKVGKGGSIGML